MDRGGMEDCALDVTNGLYQWRCPTIVGSRKHLD